MAIRQSFFRASVVIAAVVVAATASAQDNTTGALGGAVKDERGAALEGVNVIATSPQMQGNRSELTDAGGAFKISSLPPGTYQLTFLLGECQLQQKGIVVRVNKLVPIHRDIDLTRCSETVVIQDQSPTIDPTSTNQGLSLGQDYTRNIPIRGRNFDDALGAAAGAQNDGLGTSFSGSSSLENQYNLDGVNATGLTFGTVGAPLINEFIAEIEVITGGYQAEYGRATGGLVNAVTKSGTNEFHGSVFSYVTAAPLIQEQARIFRQNSSIDFVTNVKYDLSLGFELGGPVIKDKLWFFVGFQPRFFNRNVDTISKRRTDCRAGDAGGLTVRYDGNGRPTVTDSDGNQIQCVPEPGGGRPADGTFDEDKDGQFITEDLDRRRRNTEQTSFDFVTKLNYLFDPDHQGSVSFAGSPSANEVVVGAGSPEATLRENNQWQSNLALKWTSKFNDAKTELEAIGGWFVQTLDSGSVVNTENARLTPQQLLIGGTLGNWTKWGYESQPTVNGCVDSGAVGDPFPLIVNCPDGGGGYSVGGTGFYDDSKEQRISGKMAVTQRVEAIGNHEVKAGLDLEDNGFATNRLVSGPEGSEAFFTVREDRSTVEVFRYVELAPLTNTDPRFAEEACNRIEDEGRNVLDCDLSPPPEVSSATLNWAAFLQDSWQLLPNLTLNAGVRYEEQRLRYADDLQGTVDPVTGDRLGKNAMTLREMIAPRVGVVYDWTQEGRSKVYASWGRFYESIPLRINQRSFGGESFMRSTYSFASCVPETPAQDPFNRTRLDATTCNLQATPSLETLNGSGVLVAPGVEAQFLDEAIVGAEYELIEDLTVGLAYQNRRLGQVIEDVSTDAAATFILANPGSFSAAEERKLQQRINELEEGSEERLALEERLAQFQGINIFDKPRRDYHGLQLTAVKRFSRNFFVQGNYTYSRTEGNYQGLFSSNNGQVDPNITSQYDLIELLANRDGRLPQDRPHLVKLDGYYTVDLGHYGLLTPGVLLRAQSGTPINALGRHYQYGINEAFLLPRGAIGRVPMVYNMDLRLQYGKDVGNGMRVEAFLDIFNVLNFGFLAGQDAVFRDEAYTIDNANPVVGGTYSDLVFLKRVETTGEETSNPVRRNLNFNNTVVRQEPPLTRLGLRVLF